MNIAARAKHLQARRASNQQAIADFYAEFGRDPPIAYSKRPEARRLMEDFAQVEADIAAFQVGVGERFKAMPKASGRLQ
jgi:hypothetical protein